MRWFDEFRQDAWYALRAMRRNWVFTAAAVLTLTLGIAANTAIFAFIDALILRPLAAPHPERLVVLTIHESVAGLDRSMFCYPAFEQLSKRMQSVEGLFTWSLTDLTEGWGADAHLVEGGVASGNYYKTLGVSPTLGRYFGPADDTAEAAPVAVLSYSMWQHEYGGAVSVIGRKILLDGDPFTIIGVQPRGFPVISVGSKTQLTIPIHANAMLHSKWKLLDSTTVWWMSVYGRLRPGVSVAQANAEAMALTKPVFDGLHLKIEDLDISGFHAAKPRQTFGVTSGIHGDREYVARYDKPLYLLMCISFVVLGIGSLNVANLLLARAVARERELAVRLAVGAGRMRVIRQLMTESLLLAAMGAVCGATLALWITHLASNLVVATDVRVDWRVLGFVAAICLVVTMLFGVAPELRGVRLGAAALKFGRVGRVVGSAWLGQAMVCTQVALSLWLVSGAFLFSKSLDRLLTEDPGFQRKNLVFCGLDTDRSGMNAAQNARLFQGMLDQVRSMPGVSSAALTGIVPLSGNYAWSDLSKAQYPNLSREQRQLYMHHVSPSYFQTMRIPLLAGRDFGDRDAASNQVLGVLSEKAAKLYFPGRSAIGEALEVEGKSIRIIGVVKDARYQSIRDAAPQTIYMDIFHANGVENGTIPGPKFLLVRTSGTASEIGRIVRSFVKQSGRNVTVDSAMTFDQQAETRLVTERLLAFLASGFAGVGCLLVAVGLYGTIAYSVTRRTAEIGVRIALGANRRNVLWGIFREAAKLALVGACVGIWMTLLSGRFVSSLLYHTSPVDAPALAATVALLLSIVAAAAFVPAMQAARVDPLVALRWE